MSNVNEYCLALPILRFAVLLSQADVAGTQVVDVHDPCTCQPLSFSDVHDSPYQIVAFRYSNSNVQTIHALPTEWRSVIK